MTSSRSKYNKNGSALPLLQTDPVGRLRGVGTETERRLMDPHGCVMYYQVTEDETTLPPQCVAYLTSVTTGTSMTPAPPCFHQSKLGVWSSGLRISLSHISSSRYMQPDGRFSMHGCLVQHSMHEARQVCTAASPWALVSASWLNTDTNM